ncbi:MAG: hypothetical protein ACJASX_001793 [Limisphaerales bacterium]|jgi:hypothetical protein
MDFSLLIDLEVFDCLESLKKSGQRVLIEAFRAIRNSPRQYSDYSESDSSGRVVEIHVVTKHAVKFWVDHADQHIEILEIHLADRAG